MPPRCDFRPEIEDSQPWLWYCWWHLRLADSHLFATLGVPLLHGRLTTESDRGDSEPICVINLAMARKYWPGQDPLGQLIILQRLDVNGQQRPRRIVGIVADTRDRINHDPEPMLYRRILKCHSSTCNCWFTRASR